MASSVCGDAETTEAVANGAAAEGEMDGEVGGEVGCVEVVADDVLEACCDKTNKVVVRIALDGVDDTVFAVMLKYWLSKMFDVPEWKMPKKKSDPFLRS